ncbi:hypothetical protein D917_04801 [Trichinella nativa]|uniref:Uncharacterized protein n=1 Tax=Trichinella nativa TaxID=6335 RepID=A0A1Y3EY35_9BILA|nr:hypothetical protein D917_04801 [Trichinella nativa]
MKKIQQHLHNKYPPRSSCMLSYDNVVCCEISFLTFISLKINFIPVECNQKMEKIKLMIKLIAALVTAAVVNNLHQFTDHILDESSAETVQSFDDQFSSHALQILLNGKMSNVSSILRRECNARLICQIYDAPFVT